MHFSFSKREVCLVRAAAHCQSLRRGLIIYFSPAGNLMRDAYQLGDGHAGDPGRVLVGHGCGVSGPAAKVSTAKVSVWRRAGEAGLQRLQRTGAP